MSWSYYIYTKERVKLQNHTLLFNTCVFVYERGIKHYEGQCTLAAVLFIKYKSGRSQIKFPGSWTRRLSAISWPILQSQETRLRKFYKTIVLGMLTLNITFKTSPKFYRIPNNNVRLTLWRPNNYQITLQAPLFSLHTKRFSIQKCNILPA